MRGRMIMSTIMQAVSSMSAVIDHSFDNVPVGQPNVSEFIRRNYAAVKADVAAHPSADNLFGLFNTEKRASRKVLISWPQVLLLISKVRSSMVPLRC